MARTARSLSLSARTTIVLLVVLALGSALGLAVQRFVVYPSFLELEREEASDDGVRCRHAIDREVHHLGQFVSDYARWDDSWKFIEDRNQAFIEANFTIETFTENHVVAIWYVRLDGEVVYGKAHDLTREDRPEIEIPELPATRWPPKHPLLPKIATEPLSGLFMTGGGPLLTSTWPITKTNGQGPIRGWVVMARRLDDAAVRTLVDQTRVAFDIVDVRGRLAPEDQEGLARLGAGEESWVHQVDDLALQVYVPVPDVTRRTALLVRAAVPRRIADRGREALLVAAMSSLAVGLLPPAQWRRIRWPSSSLLLT